MLMWLGAAINYFLTWSFVLFFLLLLLFLFFLQKAKAKQNTYKNILVVREKEKKMSFRSISLNKTKEGLKLNFGSLTTLQDKEFFLLFWTHMPLCMKWVCDHRSESQFNPSAKKPEKKDFVASTGIPAVHIISFYVSLRIWKITCALKRDAQVVFCKGFIYLFFFFWA